MVYIGKTTKTLDERFKKHCENALSGQNNSPIFYEAIRLYGRENFEIEEICEGSDKAELNELEKKYIKEYDAQDRKKGYNIHDGGGGVNMTDEVREKISDSVKASHMDRSKGGYANKDNDNDNKRVSKLFLKFEEELISFFAIDGVKKEDKYDSESPTGTSYIIVIKMQSWPPEKEFEFADIEVRDNAFLELEAKLARLKALII